jgi:DNA-binding transcriptional regulator YhcF (GntR family)
MIIFENRTEQIRCRKNRYYINSHMAEIKFLINENSQSLKFKQLVDAVTDAISENRLKPGDMLPSVSVLMKECNLSRDTVFKAYAELKKTGVVESVPNRGYFVARRHTRVLLFLDTFKAYKEVLYHSFRDHLRKDISVDLHFHHYNIHVFETIIRESLGKYSSWVIMNFDDPGVARITSHIPAEKLLIIDWRIHCPEGVSYVRQDFGASVYELFSQNLERIRRYDRFILNYPPFTYHPNETAGYFRQFCSDYGIPWKIITSQADFVVQKGDLYFLVSDRTLAKLLDQCQAAGFETGRDVGVISYNETPMKKYVKNGITVISTDFELMGEKAAQFVNTNKPVSFTVPTGINLRSSL